MDEWNIVNFSFNSGLFWPATLSLSVTPHYKEKAHKKLLAGGKMKMTFYVPVCY
jgi:hypothetical protein